MAIEPKPADQNTRQSLMRPALTIVDSLKPAKYGPLAFRFGGGTVLMMRWQHRISKDIDLFIYDAQALTYLTPRFNETTDNIARNYTEAANTLKGSDCSRGHRLHRRRRCLPRPDAGDDHIRRSDDCHRSH